MKIQQFEDKGLAHYSYAVLSGSQIALIDPSRDITPYLKYAEEQAAKIIAIIETHPHADFVSGHFELHRTTGAALYCSALQEASYPHHTFDEGDEIIIGAVKLKSLNTPGHSPDSISIVVEQDGKDKAVFTGDTLFIGDCGRPDLRENTGKASAKREDLAKQMYYSLREKLMLLDDNVIVYPAHGAGTLCGKALSEASSSTIGEETYSNWSLQQMSEAEFVRELISEQPFVPMYFPYDVGVNKSGAENQADSLAKIVIGNPEDEKIPVIDTRSAVAFKEGHLPGAINLQDGGKFETWLGSIIAPGEAFYLLAENEAALQSVIKKTAKIGYEGFIKKAFTGAAGHTSMTPLDLDNFKTHQDHYTIVDIRNPAEVKAHPIFPDALHIPLYELRERAGEIPVDKPVVVHCAGGYRSAAGSSIVDGVLHGRAKVYDLGEVVQSFS
ncbi:Glyoxylase, beta-lactamase superfamily II [Chitinophaga sp. CF118]|uniref:MBL fold metallo-hydrolase n=1 Tax=Chitinophaga sp. CF118 TaxID=1884367 RepID=UPI0008EF1436|nr:MBL fold metallo-hydrolase [Chitinophaga sp. CF118]SFD79149.1 Glyoxylase, beta-lactamase superfamily II [Chitinophaga sp. CF118]